MTERRTRTILYMLSGLVVGICWANIMVHIERAQGVGLGRFFPMLVAFVLSGWLFAGIQSKRLEGVAGRDEAR